MIVVTSSLLCPGVVLRPECVYNAALVLLLCTKLHFDSAYKMQVSFINPLRKLYSLPPLLPPPTPPTPKQTNNKKKKKKKKKRVLYNKTLHQQHMSSLFQFTIHSHKQLSPIHPQAATPYKDDRIAKINCVHILSYHCLGCHACCNVMFVQSSSPPLLLFPLLLLRNVPMTQP